VRATKWRCRRSGLTPPRVARSACGWSLPDGRERLLACRRSRRGPPVDASPVRVVPGSAAVRFFRVRLGVTRAPVIARSCRINRPLPGTAGPASHFGPTRSARRLRSPPPRMRRRRCHLGRRDASLEVFRPLQRSLAAPRSVQWAAGPPDPPASALPRDTRAFRNEPCRETRPCGFTLSFQRLRSGGARCGGRAGVGVPAGSEIAPKVCPRHAVPVGGLLPVPVVVTIAPCGDARGTRSRHTHGRPDHTQAPPPRIRRPRRVMHHRVSSRGVPLPGLVGRATRGLVGRAGPSLGPSDGAPGVPFDPPFAGLLPPTGGASRFRATGPACRSCRRHPPD